jgi:hypothetical protein
MTGLPITEFCQGGQRVELINSACLCAADGSRCNVWRGRRAGRVVRSRQAQSQIRAACQSDAPGAISGRWRRGELATACRARNRLAVVRGGPAVRSHVWLSRVRKLRPVHLAPLV